MTRWGNFTWGDGTLWGQAETNTNLLWALEVDWDGDFTFDGSNEAVRLHRLITDRGNEYYLSGDGKGFESNAVGTAVLTLDNYDGRFDPYNTSSPLYGYLRPGKLIRLWVRNGIGGTDYPVIAGVLQDIKPYGRHGDVDLILEDGWRWLADRNVSVALQGNIYADDAIGAIADAVTYPWGYELDTGPDLIKWWWTTGKKAKTEIENVANSGVGFAFIANNGKLKYYSRQRFDEATMVIRQEHILKDIVLPQPWEFQRNIVKIAVQPRVTQSSQDIWTLNDTPSISAGETIYIWAKYTYDNQSVPATDVIAPVVTTDYTANAQADGAGADKTADITVSLTAANIFAEDAKIAITNNDAATVYLTLLKLRGKPINVPNVSEIIVEGDDAATLPRALELSLPWQQDYNIGVNIAEYLLDFLSSIQYFPTIIIEGRPEIQFALDLNDVVTLQLDEWGVDANFKIGKIRHRNLSDSCQLIRTEIKLFPVYVPPVDNYWYLGTAGLSGLGVTTYLGV